MKQQIIISFLLITSLSFAQSLEVVGGYFPYWRSTQGINFDKYNYLYFAFVFPTEEGGIESNANREKVFDDFLISTNGLDAKRLISVGSTGMDKMATTDAKRKLFADTLVKFCQHHNLDGIDMDWESIDNPTDSSNFRALMQDIRSAIGTTQLEFVITIGDGNYWLKWYSNEALDQADFLQIMIYDKTGTWSASPYGNHASMDHFKAAETYWVNRGYSREKMVMGLPYYGYKFNDATGGLAEAATYADILSEFPEAKETDNLLINSSGHYWFNGVDLIKEKVNYSVDNKFKGVFVWEIAQDDPTSPLSLEKAIHDALNEDVLTTSEINSKEKNYQVYPNPSSDILFIQNIDHSTVFNIHDSTGKQVLTGHYDTHGINIKHLPQGLYIIHINDQKISFLIK